MWKCTPSCSFQQLLVSLWHELEHSYVKTIEKEHVFNPNISHSYSDSVYPFASFLQLKQISTFKLHLL